MMQKQVFNLNNKPVKKIDLPDLVFNIKVLPDLIHQYLRYQNAKNRQGTHTTKTRSEVKGKAKKPLKSLVRIKYMRQKKPFITAKGNVTPKIIAGLVRPRNSGSLPILLDIIAS